MNKKINILVTYNIKQEGLVTNNHNILTSLFYLANPRGLFSPLKVYVSRIVL